MLHINAEEARAKQQKERQGNDISADLEYAMLCKQR